MIRRQSGGKLERDLRARWQTQLAKQSNLSRCAALILPSSSGRSIHLLVQPACYQFFGAAGDDQFLGRRTERRKGE
jgi:hypothetical protein